MTVDSTELQRRNCELTFLKRIAEELNRSVDIHQALNATLAQIAELFDLQTAWIYLVDDATGESYLAAAQNLPPGLVDNPSLMEEQSCYCLDTYRKGDLKGAANVNIITCTRLAKLVEGSRGLTYHASVPLYAQQRKLGVLNVVSSDWRELSEDDLRMLLTAGDLLSIAVERTRLFDRSVELGTVEERYRLARELHDTLGQGLTGVLLRLESLDALLEADGDGEKVRSILRETLELTRSNIDEARRSVQDLRSAPLEGRTLAGALSQLAENEAHYPGLDITVEVIGGARPLPVRIESGLYRIVREALNNTAQHAEAHSAAVSLVTTPDEVTLTIEDDGQGFSEKQIPDHRYGLIGLNERAKLLGGSLSLQSAPGTGTRVEVKVPLT